MSGTRALLAGFGAVLIAGCGSAGSSSMVSGNSGSQGNVFVAVTPTGATVVTGQTEAFSARVSGSTNTAVTWQVNSITGGSPAAGTISAAGVYTAPNQVPSPAAVSVSAVAQANTERSASASVQVVASNSNQQAQTIPIKLGTSGGNANDSNTQGNVTHCCGGTLGSLLERNGTFYILSASHVLAHSDSASIGDPIIQPGLIDTNCSSSGVLTVGNLSQFVSLETAGTDADAAIAQIVSGTVNTAGNILFLGSTATAGISDPGPPHAGNGISATLAENVAKSGRSSGLTCSTVDAINVTTSISYQKGCITGATFSVTYTGQVAVSGSNFSTAGDSGSLIVDQNTADPVGLLYGGSDTNTLANPAADALSALRDSQGNRPTFVGSASPHQVIGCTVAAASAAQTRPSMAIPAIADSELAKAQRARDVHAPELLANPYIQAIGVAPSIDHPGQAAVVLFVNSGQIPTALPDELDGVATRILQGSGSGPHGVFDIENAARLAPTRDTFVVQAVSKEELTRAKAVQSAHAGELMKQPGIQGIGLTSSADAPGEAALMIFVVRGVAANPVPVLIDGVRTRVRESSRFTAGQRGSAPDTRASCRLTWPQTIVPPPVPM